MIVLEGANCAGFDVEEFFPSEHDRAGTNAARAICKGCPALVDCLEFVMGAEKRGQQRHGVYAGLSPRQRADLARARAKDDAA